MMDNSPDIWAQAAETAWQAIHEGVKALRDDGMTLQAIAQLLGVKSPAHVAEWISGERVAPNAPFPNMLRYLAVLGLNPRDFVPSTTGEESKPGPRLKAVTPSKNCATCRRLKEAESRNAKLAKDNDKLRLECARRGGQIDLLKEQLAQAQGQPASQEGEPKKMAG